MLTFIVYDESDPYGDGEEFETYRGALSYAQNFCKEGYTIYNSDGDLLAKK